MASESGGRELPAETSLKNFVRRPALPGGNWERQPFQREISRREHFRRQSLRLV